MINGQFMEISFEMNPAMNPTLKKESSTFS